MMFCTDGLDTSDMKKFGHMDHCVQKSIDLGMDPVRAITIASRNCFDYYRMSKDLGGIAPGRLADMLILKDLKKPCNIEKVFVGGVLVAANGKIIKRTKKPAIPSWLNKTVKLAKLHEKDFVVKSRSNTAVANTIRLETEIVTRNSSAQLNVRDGNVCASPEKDIWKVAAFDRLGSSGKRTVGFLETFGAQVGAFASTWSFHENNLIVLGTNEQDMALAANEASSSGGGIAIAKDGKILAKMPLQVGGIISSDPFDIVEKNFASLGDVLHDSGCKFSKPSSCSNVFAMMRNLELQVFLYAL